MRSTVVSSFLALALLPQMAAAQDIVGTVAGESVTRAELEKHVRTQLLELEGQRYEILEQGLGELMAERLFTAEAKARGITPEALQQEEIVAKLTEPTDAEVEALYNEHKDELGGQPLEAIKERLVQYLKQQRAGERSQAFLAELRQKHGAKVMLLPPVVEVDAGGREGRGKPDAPITIIAFSDYECPFCKVGEQTLEKVLATYGDKVRHVHRDFPLPFHQNAHAAAQAARCAETQGKFWEYHTKLFTTTKGLSTETYQGIADEVGLNRTDFDECLSSGRFKDAVDKDLAAGQAAGVSGTPAFFINGRSLSGAQPFEKFQSVIDGELARLEATAATN